MVDRGPLDAVLARVAAARRRVRRLERRELSEIRRWLGDTTNLLHLSVVVFVPVLLGVVTYLSNRVQTLSFLLFPPLAAGTYTLFSDPESRYANPVRFVASLSAGAICGLASFTTFEVLYGGIPPGVVLPESAALAIFLTGLVTWAGGIEAPSAFSTALLALVTGEVDPVTYVVSVILAASFVAIVFAIWREEFYERRAQFLYETVRGDDHVLVPMRGEMAVQTAFFGARIAAAHDAGKVVLLDILSGDRADDGESSDAVRADANGTHADREETSDLEAIDGDPSESATDTDDAAAEAPDTDVDPHGETDRAEASMESRAADAADRLERCAARIRTRIGVPCEIAVVAGSPVPATVQAARNTNCDLVVAPHEETDRRLSGYVRGIFDGPMDAVAFRSQTQRREWNRVLVFVARSGDTAHGMIDFATRVAGNGTVSVTTCIESEAERRRAETRLERLVETAEGAIETRVARATVDEFVAANADSYDLLVLGSSGDRPPVSRFVSPPLFGRIQDLDVDVAVFDRANP